MSIAEQFELALEFMVLGMGVVFAFLTFLVLIVKWTSIFIQKVECSEPVAVVQQDSGGSGHIEGLDETVTAVISAAVYQHRKQFPTSRN